MKSCDLLTIPSADINNNQPRLQPEISMDFCEEVSNSFPWVMKVKDIPKHACALCDPSSNNNLIVDTKHSPGMQNVLKLYLNFKFLAQDEIL